MSRVEVEYSYLLTGFLLAAALSSIHIRQFRALAPFLRLPLLAIALARADKWPHEKAVANIDKARQRLRALLSKSEKS